MFLQLLLLTALSGITPISGTNTSSNPVLDNAPTGQATAIWTQTPNTVEAAYFDSATWKMPQVLGTGSFPQIAVDGSGNAFAVWIDSQSNQVFSRRFNAANQVWASAVQLSNATFNATPQIAANGNGKAIAVWVSSSPTPQLLVASYNGAWSAPVVIATNTGSFPSIVLDNRDVALITWTGVQAVVETVTVMVP